MAEAGSGIRRRSRALIERPAEREKARVQQEKLRKPRRRDRGHVAGFCPGCGASTVNGECVLCS